MDSVEHQDILRQLTHINMEIQRMANAFERLKSEVAETKTAVSEATAKIAELVQALKDSAGNETETNALADELDQLQKDISAAVNPDGTPPVEPPVEENPATTNRSMTQAEKDQKEAAAASKAAEKAQDTDGDGSGKGGTPPGDFTDMH